MSLISSVVSDNKLVVFPNFVIDSNMSCNIVIEEASSISSSITIEQKISNFSAYYIMASNQVPQHVITGVGGSGVSGVLFLKSSILAGDFTKIFFPLSTNLFTFG
jgi:hypothetical protein